MPKSVGSEKSRSREENNLQKAEDNLRRKYPEKRYIIEAWNSTHWDKKDKCDVPYAVVKVFEKGESITAWGVDEPEAFKKLYETLTGSTRLSDPKGNSYRQGVHTWVEKEIPGSKLNVHGADEGGGTTLKIRKCVAYGTAASRDAAFIEALCYRPNATGGH